MTRPDLTVRRANPETESGAFSFIPHSQKADDFLFTQFACYLPADRDLNMQDLDLIVRRAERRGFVVRDLVRGA